LGQGSRALKAVVIREFGPPSVMRIEDVPTPEPGPGEVLVAVHAVSVNRTLDLTVRAGKYARRPALPHVLGVDPSGIVVKVGEGDTDLKVGDRVTALIRISPATATEPPKLLGVNVWGGYAEYVKLPAANAHPIPANVDFVTATVVGRHAPTAFNLLREEARLQAGEWVLVMGAAGGLGSAGVQAAKYLGGNVIAAAGTDARVQAAVDLGAEAGVNYRNCDLTAEVMRITGGRGVNVVFENVGDPDLFPKAFATLMRNGRLVTAGGHGGGTVPLDVNRLYLNHIRIIGSTGETLADMDVALRAAGEGRFKPLIDSVLPLAQAAQAHAMVADRNIVGKVVLDPRR
jgi:NADPH:quinone reductase-like Zn-dependent oxidoreductase